MKNKALKTLFIYNGIFLLAASMLGPLYAIYVEKFVTGIMSVSVSWSAFLISTTVFTFLISKNGDRIKEKEYLIMAGYVLRIISWVFFIFVDSLFSLIFVQILLGLGEALGTPSFNAIFAKHLDKDKFINEYCNWALISNLFSAISVIVGGVIVSNFGFNFLFITMSIMSTISFLGLLLKPRRLL